MSVLKFNLYFQTAGSSIDSNICTIILGVVNIMATIFSNAFIDRLGRKILLYISSIGMIISLGVFGAYFYLKVKLAMKFKKKTLILFFALFFKAYI